MADNITSIFRSVPPPSALDRFSEGICGFPCAIRGCRRFEDEQGRGEAQPIGIPPRQIPRSVTADSLWLVLTVKGSEVALIASKSRQKDANLQGMNFIEWCFVSPIWRKRQISPPDYQEAAAWDLETRKHVPIASAQALYVAFGDHLFSDLKVTNIDDSVIEWSQAKIRPSLLISSSFSQIAGCKFEQYSEIMPGLQAPLACAVESSLHDNPIWNDALICISYLHQESTDGEGRRVLRWLPFQGGGLLKRQCSQSQKQVDFDSLSRILKQYPILAKRHPSASEFTFADAFRRDRILLLNAVETSRGAIQISRGEWISFCLYWLLLRACLWNESFRALLMNFKAGDPASLDALLKEKIRLPYSSLFTAPITSTKTVSDVPELRKEFLLVFPEAENFQNVIQQGLGLHNITFSNKSAWQRESGDENHSGENLLDVIAFMEKHFVEGVKSDPKRLSGLPMYQQLGWVYRPGDSPLAAAISTVCQGFTNEDFSQLNERLEACYKKSIVPIIPLLHQRVCGDNLRQYVTMPITEAQLDRGEGPITVAWAHIMTSLDDAQTELQISRWAEALSMVSVTLAGVISADQASSRDASASDDMSHAMKKRAESIKSALNKLPEKLQGYDDNWEITMPDVFKYITLLQKETERMSKVVDIAHILKGSSMDSIDQVLNHNDREHVFTTSAINLGDLIQRTVNELNQKGTGRVIKLPPLQANIVLNPCIASGHDTFHFSEALIEQFIFEIVENAQKKAPEEQKEVTIELECNSQFLLWRNKASGAFTTSPWEKPKVLSSGLGSIHHLLRRFEIGSIETRLTEEPGELCFELRISINGLAIHAQS